MNLEKEIIGIVAKIIQIPENEIKIEASFMDDYGMDSLRALEILAEIENKYHITIDPDELTQMTSIEKVAEITQKYLDEE